MFFSSLKLREKFFSIVFQESMITIECIIPQKYHRTVMGPKGRKVQDITYEYDVQIKIPDRGTPSEYFKIDLFEKKNISKNSRDNVLSSSRTNQLH